MEKRGLMRREREITDPDVIRMVLDEAKVIHIGLTDGPYPYVVPMNYGYTWQDGKLTFYLHGGHNGYKYDLIEKNPNCAFELNCRIVPFKGEVACKNGISYYSIMGRGTARFLDDPREKSDALSLLMQTQTSEPASFTEALTRVVRVFCIDVTEFTAKHRPFPGEPKPRQ